MNEKLTLNGFNSSYEDARMVAFGVPLDGTTSFRPGTRFAPAHIRSEFIGLETYSPYLDMDLKEYKIHDQGDLYLPIGNIEKSLERIYQKSKEIVSAGKTPFMIGGEHLATYPAFKAVYEKHPDVFLLHFDAHTDLRDEFYESPLSHATVIKRCWDLVGDGRIFQFGIRSGDKKEFEWSRGHTVMERYGVSSLSAIINKLKGKKIYVTIDLDVLDPAYFSGTGTPEPGGISFKELLQSIHEIKEVEIVGMDIVELSPHYDSSGASTAVACKVLREMTLVAMKNYRR